MIKAPAKPIYDPNDYVLVKILVPKNNEKGPTAAELFFAALHGTFDYSARYQPVMSFEIVSINKYIQFYFYAPKYLKEFVEGQLYAQYPAIEISIADDYAAKMLYQKSTVGLDLKTTKDDVYPIKTFESFEDDPMSGITSILSQLDGEEELWIQICVTPADDLWQKKGIAYSSAIQAGRDPSEPIWKSLVKGVFGAVKDVGKTAEATTTQQPVSISSPQATALKGIEDKTTKLGFKTKIRIVSLSNDPVKAKQRLNAVVGAFKQYNTGNMNGFIQGRLIEGEPIKELYMSRALGPDAYILNTAELASIFHLPSENVATPTMDWVGAKKGEPPQNIPLIKEVSSEDISLVGETNFRSTISKFGLKIKDRALHVYAIGKTGTGKSTMLGNMIVDDIVKGRGVAVVDPHGDLIADVLEYIPDERIDDVVYFSPADRDYPIGFNLLESVDPQYKNIVASGIVGVFKKIFGESWGPRLEYILRNVVLGLLDYPGATMLSIIKILTDTKFRRGVIDKIEDPVIRDFFLNEYERYDQKFRTEAVAPIQNKVGQFLSSTVIRNIVGQEHSTVDLREVMDKKKILLIDLSIGKIGEDNSALLGSMLITKIQMAAMSRADMKREERVPFYLYVDEFQNFATDSFAVILSESRKYGLSLTVTNQYIAQMPENVANAVFGNVGTLIVFRVGASDADMLQKEFVPVFEPADLTNLNNYTIYVKMAIDGVTSTPFSAKTLLTDFDKTNNTEKIIAQSRQKYSKNRTDIEEEIKKKLEVVSPGEVIQGLNTQGGGVAPKNEILEKSQMKTPEGHPEEAIAEESHSLKSAEDYDQKKWYFINRTNYRRAADRNEDGTKKREGRADDGKGGDSELKPVTPVTDDPDKNK